ncbi:unnamed protein product [Rotaria sp. Silwood2]|nr:unnamed protein product [Rotaria sp. Silwood2]
MNSDIEKNTETLKTPSQDAQGRWYELLSPAQVLTEQQQPLATTTTTIKKKPRNRKLQRYWRKLRKQRINETTIRKLKRSKKRERQQTREQRPTIHEEHHEEIILLNDTVETPNESEKILPGPYNPQRSKTKRKRDETTNQNGTIVKSFSQMSMKDQERKKKKRSTSSLKLEQQQQEKKKGEKEENEKEENNQDDQREHVNNIVLSTMNEQKVSFHYYLNVSKRKFKRMLKTSMVGDKHVLHWCNTEEKLNYIYNHTRLLDRVYYLKLEQNLWENYTIYGETYHCWTPRLSKTFIQQNQLKSDYRQTRKSMEVYRKKLIQQIEEAEQNLEQHRLLLENHQHQDSIVNEAHLWATILALVRKGQHKLTKEYKHRKKYFKNSAIDCHLVKACYDCQPTQEEIRSMQLIWQATYHQYKSQEDVDVSKQHLYIKRLPKSFDYLDQPRRKVENTLSNSIYNNNIRTTLSTRHKKIIAQNKCDLMKFHISLAEAAVRSYQQIAEKEKQNLFNRMVADPLRQSMANSLKEDIERRQKHIQQQIQYITKRRICFFYHRSDDRRQKWNRRSYCLDTYWDILPSSPIIEVFSHLTSEQLALLAYGPKYVPPCQSRFFSKKKREKIIEQEYQTIMYKITEFFREHSFNVSEKRVNEFSIDFKSLLQRLYTKNISRKLYIRAKREHKLMMSIRHYLHRYQQVILRRTDKSKVFHLGDAHDYEEKVRQYMQETNAYEEIISGISPLATNLQQVISLLDRLYHTEKPLITKKQYENMIRQSNEIELGHLYFLPKPHKIATPLRPIVASIHAPATKISAFLDDLLRPIFYRVANNTSYINGTHVVQQLEQYQREGHLLPTTKFITIDVKNLYTMIPKAGALDALYRFCMKHATKERQMGNLTVNTIIRLACVVLDTNCFVFDNKYYKQIRGGAMGSPFTTTLANIYMYEWEQHLIQYQQERHEVYGRYIDDIFMTSNESLDKIKDLLDQEAKKDVNIGINYKIGESTEFLDVFIDNCQGKLKTSVFRKPAAEPYLLPYQSDHPHHIRSNTIYTALLRASRLCSNVELFDEERLNIEIALLLNGFSPKFITHHIKRFFRNYNARSIYKELDAEAYQQLHQQLLTEFFHSNDQLQQQTSKEEQVQVTEEKPEKAIKKSIKQKKLILHYRYEKGPLSSFNREFRKLWEKHFCYKNSKINNVRLILGIRINPSLDRLLIKKKPSRTLLTRMDTITSTTTVVAT